MFTLRSGVKSRASRDRTERKRVKSLKVGRLSVHVLKKLLPSASQRLFEPQRHVYGRAGSSAFDSLEIRPVDLGGFAKLLLAKMAMRP